MLNHGKFIKGLLFGYVIGIFIALTLSVFAQSKSGTVTDFTKIPDQANLGNSKQITLPEVLSNEKYYFHLKENSGKVDIELHCVNGGTDVKIGTISGSGSISFPKKTVDENGNPITNNCQKVYVKTKNCKKCKGNVTYEIK